jgi:hypothetical protein
MLTLSVWILVAIFAGLTVIWLLIWALLPLAEKWPASAAGPNPHGRGHEHRCARCLLWSNDAVVRDMSTLN